MYERLLNKSVIPDETTIREHLGEESHKLLADLENRLQGDYQLSRELKFITASCTGALLWAKQIIEHLDVLGSNALEYWYDYFSTGEPKRFFALMQSLPSNNKTNSPCHRQNGESLYEHRKMATMSCLPGQNSRSGQRRNRITKLPRR